MFPEDDFDHVVVTEYPAWWYPLADGRARPGVSFVSPNRHGVRAGLPSFAVQTRRREPHPAYRASLMRKLWWPVVPAPLFRSRPLLIAVSLSLGLHVLLAVVLLLMPRLPRPDALTPEQGTVELLMVEQKGGLPGGAAQPRETVPNSQTMAPAAKPDPAPDNASPPAQKVPLPAIARQAEPVPQPPKPAPPAAAKPRPQAPDKPAEVPPIPPASRQAPVFDLRGTDSEANAIALGGHILPALPDDRFRNRPPAYPIEAQMRGQHGQVVVVIHIGENGLAKSVEVLESSGVPALDQAAVTAVRKWRFHPAMKDGRIVESNMPFRFVFEEK